ncbi:GerW family sporulation protein [Zongyangia hominis]|uniref:GerW family sporulation protein n=1 Tax=Zongyangia hominis TaxID=2763677 RepID=A0A926ICB1_9FIRM|nr:GerW family sporulation protein [Zongyangia hominis]MBC8570930.1 GerW family sporulation protein [Zongyangia hominis]
MAEHPIEGLMNTAMQKLRELVDVNTIIGDPITTPDGILIIPVSKVTFGFGSGGSDWPTQNPKETFGGGSGGGVSISPIGFLVVSGGEVRLLQLAAPNNTGDRLVNMVPDLVDKVSGLFSKDNKKKGEETADKQDEK